MHEMIDYQSDVLPCHAVPLLGIYGGKMVRNEYLIVASQ